MLKREELTAERIEQIVEDARKAGYDFFLSAEEREASLEQALSATPRARRRGCSPTAR